jgi:hypothetical protein
MKLLGCLPCLLCACALAQDFEPAPFAPASLSALITEADLDEISGIAASRRNDGIFWIHNDAPRPARLDAIDETGKRRARLRIDGVRAVDWEDIASYELDGKAWLLIGDIGDNAGTRKDYELIAVEEPALGGNGLTEPIKPAWRMRFRYPDGSHDVEAMAVDVAAREVLLVSKHAPPVLYSLPLGPGGPAVALARKRLSLNLIPQPIGDALLARFPAARLGGSPTGLDIDSRNRNAVLLTYRDIWVFPRHPRESWVQAFARSPQRLLLPPMAQAEAIGFDRDDSAIVVSGERLPAPLLRFEATRLSDKVR